MLPRFDPKLIPDKIRLGALLNIFFNPNFTQSAGEPVTEIPSNPFLRFILSTNIGFEIVILCPVALFCEFGATT